MSIKLYSKDGKYAVKYTSLTRKDKSLFIYLNDKNPVICDGKSNLFKTDDDFRCVLFKEDDILETILSLLESLKSQMESQE